MSPRFWCRGRHVPKVLDQDLAQGFLLLSDLGDTTYLQALIRRTPTTSTPKPSAR